MSYAGDLTPTETYQLLADTPEAVLVDVRTAAEWAYVGVPDLSALGREVIKIEWVRFPDGAQNTSFLAELAAAGVGPEHPVAFLCRSGVRSKAAAEAATKVGYSRAYNILDGFEGNPNGDGHRGVSGGWKVAGLPWKQA